jgi:hypothetical protein
MFRKLSHHTQNTCKRHNIVIITVMNWNKNVVGFMYIISREINMNVHKIAYTVTVCILLLCYAIVCNIKFHVNITESFKIKSAF